MNIQATEELLYEILNIFVIASKVSTGSMLQQADSDQKTDILRAGNVYLRLYKMGLTVSGLYVEFCKVWRFLPLMVHSVPIASMARPVGGKNHLRIDMLFQIVAE